MNIETGTIGNRRQPQLLEGKSMVSGEDFTETYYFNSVSPN
jgi:hypothetical protein